MYDFIWAGTEASFEAYKRMEEKYALNDQAYLSYQAYHDNKPEIDEVYGVGKDRKGLYLLEKIGDTSVVKVHGSLVASYRWYHSFFAGEVTSYEAIIDALAIAEQDESTKRIVMDFASSGGMVNGLDTVNLAIERISKPVVGHTDRHSFSASYWMMVSCDLVSGSRMSEFGSIGTLAIIRTYADPEKNMGMKFHVLREGEHKALGNPYEDLTPEAKAILQKNLTESNNFFLEHVSLRRGLLIADRDEWGQGDTYFAQDAMRRGMIDRVTTLNDILTRGSDGPMEPRSVAMKISEAKLAKIAAGADPKDVLTTAELKVYNEQLEAQAKAEEDAKTAAAAEEDKKKAEAEAKEKAEHEEEGEDDPAKPAASASATLSSELRDALKANGKLEARAEALQADLEASNKKLEAATEASNSLIVVAQAAVKNLQRALGKPLEAKSSVPEILAQYNELQSAMAKTFKTGQQSSEARTDDDTVEQVGRLGYRDQNAQAIAKTPKR